MSNVEHQLGNQEQFLNQMQAYISPMVVITNKMICNCSYCDQRCSDVNRFMRTLENLNLGVQVIYNLLEHVISHREYLLTNCSTETKHPYHIVIVNTKINYLPSKISYYKLHNFYLFFLFSIYIDWSTIANTLQ